MNAHLIVRRLRHRKDATGRAAAKEIVRLRGLLVEANDAFDECTGDYAKELCDGEAWRVSS